MATFDRRNEITYWPPTVPFTHDILIIYVVLNSLTRLARASTFSIIRDARVTHHHMGWNVRH